MSHNAPFIGLILFFNFRHFYALSFCASNHISIPPNLNWSNIEIRSIDYICSGHFNEENYGLLYWNEEGFQKVALNGTLKVAASFVNTGSLYEVILPNGTIKSIHGLCSIPYAYLLDLQFIFNFTIQLVPSYGWMEEGQNNTITGAGDQVASGLADIGIDIARPVPYRARHLQFLHPVRQDRVTIVFRQPFVEKYRNVLLLPFQGGLWKRTVTAWIILFLSIAFISKTRLVPMVMNFHNFLLPVTAILLARGTSMSSILQGGNVGKSVFLVILVASWFGLMMYSIYSAFILSYLRSTTYPVKNFKDLINHNYELVAQSSLPDFASMYVGAERGEYYNKLATNNFKTEEITLARIFREVGDVDDEAEYYPVGWFVLKSDFTYLALKHGYSIREICKIHSLGPTKRPQTPRVLSMYIQQGNWSLKEQLNRKILDIMGKGLGSREVRRFETEFQPNCRWGKRKRVEVQRIRFYDVCMAYFILACGVGIALGVAFLEGIASCIWERSWRRGIQNNNLYQHQN